MPIDPNGVFETVSHAISKFPPALFAAALLGGPTLIWLIVRFASPPAPRKRADLVGQELLWVCGSCRSINADQLLRCYSCHRPRAADLIPVVTEEPEGEPAHGWEEQAPEVGIPVGPGLPVPRPAAASWLAATVTGSPGSIDDRDRPAPEAPYETEPAMEPEPELEPAFEIEPELDVAVGSDVVPRVFEPVVLEPRLKVSARAPHSGSRSEPGPRPRAESHTDARPEPRTGLRATARRPPRGRWTDLPPADLPRADPPEAADDGPRRRARGSRSGE